MSRARRAAVAAVVLLAAALLGGVRPDAASAAPWCGTLGSADRPAAVAGEQIRVVYMLPSDGLDRSAERAPLLSGDVDAITGWWQGQDSARTPRFDVSPFSCGLQADLTLVRLTRTAAELQPLEGRARLVFDALSYSPYLTYLVYYDGPVDGNVCGQGSGQATSSGIAIVYLQACTEVEPVTTAAHELLHAFGALEDSGPPHPCPDDRGHPCDSPGDILWPFAQLAPLTSFALDLGRDDYYGHAGTWADVQDSSFLVHVGQQVGLSLTLSGSGHVTSLVPGVDCVASCASQWNAGSKVELTAEPAAGQRLVDWGTPGCRGSGTCRLQLDQATSLTPRFAPATFALAVSVAGKGRVASRPVGLSCPTRCVRSFTSFAPVALVASPAKGWKLRAWTGACRGVARTCTVRLDKTSRARATFVRIPAR